MTGERRGRSRLSAHARGLADQVGLRVLVLLVGAAVLAASGLFGGLRQVEAEPVATLAVDDEFDAAPFEVVVRDARTLDAVPGRTARGIYLLVDVDVRSTDDSEVPSAVAQELVGVAGDLEAFTQPLYGEETAPIRSVEPEVLVREDATTLGTVPPDLTYSAAWVWELAGDAPDKVTVVVRSHTERESSIDRQVGWFDPVTAGRLTLPVATETLPPDPAETDGTAP
ncbi:MAG: hypothetical protein Q7T56_12205 [Nocardioidaceae bacterium]|nr:hypothetical protein [Nocardioidaceae bacterium]